MELSPEYMALNDELRSLLFTIERYCGLEVGGGRVFNDMTKRREIADTKHIFSFIAITYLAYTHKQVMAWMGIKYLSNITYAINRIIELIEYNPAYRNRMYNVAINNGIMGLLRDIEDIVDNSKCIRR